MHVTKQWVQLLSIAALATGIAISGAVLIRQSDSGSTANSSSPSAAIAQNLAPDLRKVMSFRSPTCGCCGAWVEHMKTAGFEVNDRVTEEMASVKREHQVPEDLTACHTAIVGGYVVEGHIPAADIQRLLVEQPDVTGIAVPGMPIGSPGMESGDLKEPYAVFTFDASGQTAVLAEHL